MKNITIIRTGVIGSLIAAICCFTPAFVLLLGAIGLSAWIAWVDYILVPTLVLFMAITSYGWYFCHLKKEN